MTQSSPPFGLAPETLSKIIEIFKKHSSIKKVIIYGSRAKDTYRPGSDIDICLEGEQVDDSTLIQLDEDIDNLLLPYEFDISLKKSIKNEKLLDHIHKIGKVIFER